MIPVNVNPFPKSTWHHSIWSHWSDQKIDKYGSWIGKCGIYQDLNAARSCQGAECENERDRDRNDEWEMGDVIQLVH